VSGFVVAIDGPAASGKSSTARAVAERLGFHHLDSGALYRAVTLVALEERARVGGDSPLPFSALDIERILRRAEDRGLLLVPDGAGFAVYLDGVPAEDRIRAADVTAAVSEVAAIPAVRTWVDLRLRQLVRAGRDVVVDGRDIGTVVFPEAPVKVFLTASPEARALRRLRQRGTEPGAAEVAAEAERLANRDRLDAGRAVAPLRRASDAVEIDTSNLAFAAQVERIVALVAPRLGGRPPG